MAINRNEKIQYSVPAYYHTKSPLSDLSRPINWWGGHEIPMRGEVVATNDRILFFSSSPLMKKNSILVNIYYKQIDKIEYRKKRFVLLKFIPCIDIHCYNEKLTFTTQGNPREFIKLQELFEYVKTRLNDQ
ncbi:PH domain-containing protein [Priestia megaterium]